MVVYSDVFAVLMCFHYTFISGHCGLYLAPHAPSDSKELFQLIRNVDKLSQLIDELGHKTDIQSDDIAVLQIGIGRKHNTRIC